MIGNGDSESESSEAVHIVIGCFKEWIRVGTSTKSVHNLKCVTCW